MLQVKQHGPVTVFRMGRHVGKGDFIRCMLFLFCGKGFKYLRADEDFSTILDSLRRLSALEFDTLFCSLLGVVKDGKAALGRKIAVMEELKAQTLHLYQRGRSPHNIRKILLGREGFMQWVTGGHYAKQNTIDSILNGIR